MKEIPPFKLIPQPLNDEAASLPGFKWASPVIGTRHRLGGKPEFIQGDETPRCSCGDVMTFYAQLDSVSPEFNLADGGMIYVFVCFGCFETKAILQSS